MKSQRRQGGGRGAGVTGGDRGGEGRKEDGKKEVHRRHGEVMNDLFTCMNIFANILLELKNSNINDIFDNKSEIQKFHKRLTHLFVGRSVETSVYTGVKTKAGETI